MRKFLFLYVLLFFLALILQVYNDNETSTSCQAINYPSLKLLNLPVYYILCLLMFFEQEQSHLYFDC